MVKVVYGKNFIRSAKKLDKKLQIKLADKIYSLQKNAFNPSLHTKNLSGKLVGLYSFRITRDWRVILQFLDPQTIQLIDVANRKDIYR